MFDSLGAFYSAISSTQGGWTWLSCEGRYMGAAAWGDMNRASNPYYARLKEVLNLGTGGEVHLNRAMANWYCDPFDHPYKQALTEILGEPLKPDQLWNPDAVLRVEDIHHRPDTKDRLDKAAATQLVFEDAMIHDIVVVGLIHLRIFLRRPRAVLHVGKTGNGSSGGGVAFWRCGARPEGFQDGAAALTRSGAHGPSVLTESRWRPTVSEGRAFVYT